MCLWPKVATVGALERQIIMCVPAREALAAARARKVILGPGRPEMRPSCFSFLFFSAGVEARASRAPHPRQYSRPLRLARGENPLGAAGEYCHNLVQAMEDDEGERSHRLWRTCWTAWWAPLVPLSGQPKNAHPGEVNRSKRHCRRRCDRRAVGGGNRSRRDAQVKFGGKGGDVRI